MDFDDFYIPYSYLDIPVSDDNLKVEPFKYDIELDYIIKFFEDFEVNIYEN